MPASTCRTPACQAPRESSMWWWTRGSMHSNPCPSSRQGFPTSPMRLLSLSSAVAALHCTRPVQASAAGAKLSEQRAHCKLARAKMHAFKSCASLMAAAETGALAATGGSGGRIPLQPKGWPGCGGAALRQVCGCDRGGRGHQELHFLLAGACWHRAWAAICIPTRPVCFI